MAKGYLNLANNAILEGAIVAARNYLPHTINSSGGVIYADSVTLRNNLIGVDLAPYQNYHFLYGTLQNDLSSFTRCTFVADADFGEDYEDFNSMVDMRGVNGIRFSACHFRNSYPNEELTYAHEKKIGIFSRDATFQVAGICLTNPLYPCELYQLSRFDGFAIGITAGNLNSIKTFSVSNTYFDQNARSIVAQRVDNIYVVNNTFIVGMSLPELNNTPYTGIESIRCTGYRIEENLLEIAGEIPGTAEAAGIVIIHSLNEPNLVYKNDLRGLHCANLANGDNTSMLEQGGLQYICNENKGNAFDFAVKGLPTGTIGIAANQGSSVLSAGNMFSLETVVFGSEADFQNLGEHINYYGPPPLLNYTENTITLLTGDPRSCPSRLPSRGAGGLLTGEEINTMELTINYGTDTFEIFQAANTLVRHYLMGEDSIQMDSARIWLTRKGSLDAYFATVDYWLQLRDTAAAQQMLDDIPYLISLSGYTQDEYDYFHDLKSLQIAALQTNQSDSLLVATHFYDLKDIADAGLYYASVQAQVLLNDVANAGYRPAVIMPEAEEQNLAAPLPGGVADAISEVDLYIQTTPNPAVQETVFHYRLPAGTEQAFIVVTTMDGKPIARIPVDAGNGQVRWNTAGRQPGIYFYYLAADSQTLLTGRLVISQ